MRKVVLALLFLIAGLSQLYAQSDGSYKLTLTFSRIKNTGNDMQSTEFVFRPSQLREQSNSMPGAVEVLMKIDMFHLHLPSYDISMHRRISSLRNYNFGVRERGVFSLVQNQERAPMS